MMTPEERYKSDPTFKIMVDQFYDLFSQGETTESEVRLAASTAMIHYRQMNPQLPSLIKRSKGV